MSKLTWHEFTLAQAKCERGGWARTRRAPAPIELGKAERRWARRSFRHGEQGPDGEYQCGGCDFFAAFGADYGVCWNAESPMDGLIVFEHGGCREHSEKLRADDRKRPEIKKVKP